MSTEVDNYLEHLGLEVGDDLKHYGTKGMKWGVRKSDSSSSGSGSGGWTADQKQKARNVAMVAGTVAVGAALVAATVYAGKGGAYGGFSEKAKAGQSIADSVLKAKGSTKLSVDPDLAKFIKDAPSRILSDQKGWSTALGKSLTRIQSEDAAYMAEYIKNYAPKALGA